VSLRLSEGAVRNKGRFVTHRVARRRNRGYSQTESRSFLAGQLQSFSGEQTSKPRPFEKIIGASRGMSGVLDQIRMVAATDCTVLIQGETGTGKESIAEAIRLLIHHFVRTHASRMGKKIQWISCEALAALEQHDWPGNVGELQNVIERAVILTHGSVLQIPLDSLEETDIQVVSPPRTLAAAERAHVVEALNQTGWVVGGTRGAAARLGLARTTLVSLMRRLNIDRSHDGISAQAFPVRRSEQPHYSAAGV